jgi:hypothetical protein
MYTNGKNEVVNRSLGNTLIYLVGDKWMQWDLGLAPDKVVYKNLVNKSTRKSIFHIVNERLLRVVIDLECLLEVSKMSADAYSFVE